MSMTSGSTSDPNPSSLRPARSLGLIWLSLVVALAVLAVGLLTGPHHHAILNVLSLSMAVGGVGVAFVHVYQEQAGKLECPLGVIGIGTAPQQALVPQSMLLLVLVVGIVRCRAFDDRPLSASLGAVLLGLLMAVASVTSAPPMPPVPTKPYGTALDMCRPPFRGN